MLLRQIVLVLAVFFCVTGCNGSREYDNGYEAAWDGAEEPSWYSSKEYKEGYEQGKEDSEVYDMGFSDGYNDEECVYPEDPDYLEGYKDGKAQG